jgi:hypothetical protein
MKTKMKKILTLKFLLLVIPLLCFMSYSCSDEDWTTDQSVSTDNESVPEELLDKAKEWHKQETKQPGFLSIKKTSKHILQPEWDKARLKKLEDGRSEIIAPVKDINLNSKLALVRKVVFSVEGDEVKDGKIIEVFATTTYVALKKEKILFDLNQLKDFTGSVIYYNVKYKYKNSEVYKGGIKVLNGQAGIFKVSNFNKGGGIARIKEERCWDVWYVSWTPSGNEDWVKIGRECKEVGGDGAETWYDGMVGGGFTIGGDTEGANSGGGGGGGGGWTPPNLFNVPIELNTIDPAAMKAALAGGITTTAEYAHKMYKQISAYLQAHPTDIQYVNYLVKTAKILAEWNVNMNPKTMTFSDVFFVWVLELGESSQINFGQNDLTTTQLKTQDGVNQARAEQIKRLRSGNLAPGMALGWTYGQAEFYDGMANGNFITSFLGSYSTKCTHIQNNGDGSYTVTFEVRNTSGWDSATRLRIDNDHNGQHDGIIPDKQRGEGILLGGNLQEVWTWTETVRP